MILNLSFLKCEVSYYYLLLVVDLKLEGFRLDFRMHMDFMSEKEKNWVFWSDDFLNSFQTGFTHPSSVEILHEYVLLGIWPKQGLELHFTIPVVVLQLSHDLLINTHIGIYHRVCKILFFYFIFL